MRRLTFVAYVADDEERVPATGEEFSLQAGDQSYDLVLESIDQSDDEHLHGLQHT